MPPLDVEDISSSDSEVDVDVDVDVLVSKGEELIEHILARKPIAEIKALVADGAPPWFQNEEEGTSPLHAAAYVESEELVQFMIDNGAIWNAVDNLKNTAGDIALSYNNEACYTIIRDAGIRSEMLLTALSKQSSPIYSSLSLVLKASDSTAAGSPEAFLASKLRYTTDEHGQETCVVKVGDDEEVGVMMGWERGIMQDTVRKLCDDHPQRGEGLKILNVGFGLGIVDSFFQERSPSQHVIIEPHPDVIQHMRERGWFDKPNVTVLQGTWQDFVESDELLGVGGFDVIYTDTFSEDYTQLHRFFRSVPDLLAGPESRFGFFNGLGATNALFYDVYSRVAELHLSEVGVDIEWSDVDVFDGDADRWGKTREYFGMRLYRLPVGKMRVV